MLYLLQNNIIYRMGSNIFATHSFLCYTFKSISRRYKTETEAYDFLSNLDITKVELEKTSIKLLRMH